MAIDIKTDYAICYAIRASGESYEFLQLKKTAKPYMDENWGMPGGAIEHGEKPSDTALRELYEETCLIPIEFYLIDRVSSSYLEKMNAIIHGIPYCAIVPSDAKVIISNEHLDYRWIPIEQADNVLIWNTERDAMTEIKRTILNDGPAKIYLKIIIK